MTTLTEKRQDALRRLKAQPTTTAGSAAVHVITESLDGASGSAYVLRRGRVEHMVWGCGVNLQTPDDEAQAFFDSLT